MIAAIVLAAGASSRMGQPKALLRAGNGSETFVGCMVATLRLGGADDVVVVVRGEQLDVIAASVDSRMARLVVNPHPEDGQLSSVVVALAAIDRPGMNAALVTPVDLPLLQSATVAAVLAGYGRTHQSIVRPVRRGRRGHPVLFDRSMFSALRSGDRARGMRAVIEAHLDRAVEVEVDDEGIFRDVDTPEDYRAVTGLNFDDPPPGG